MRIVSYPEVDVPDGLRRQVLVLHDLAWPGEEPTPLGPTHDPRLEPLSMLLLDGERVLSALDILSKPIEHAGRTFAASGLATVVTDPAVRGAGHGRRLVAAARATLASRGADLGIFTCNTPLGPFYEGAGFAVLPGTVIVGGTRDDPFASDLFDKVTLASFHSAAARASAATFRGARIALYPGTIDRLW